MEVDFVSLIRTMLWSLFGNWPFAMLCGLALIVTIVRWCGAKPRRRYRRRNSQFRQNWPQKDRWFRSERKGCLGETLLHQFLCEKLDNQQYLILNDIMLPTEDGTTTQIDHIVVSQWGVFVIETKTYSGWIFGSEYDAQWTVTHGNRKDSFQNPLRQNYKHIATLSECLGISKEYFKTVIAFCGESEFKKDMPNEVMLFGDVADYIKEHSVETIIPPEQVHEVADTILEWYASLNEKQKIEHVYNLRKTHEPQEINQEKLNITLNDDSTSNDKKIFCPRCGAPMVLRKRKVDGLPFWGCSQFPKCRCIVNVESVTYDCEKE